jgi:hypothetical protein
VSCGACACGLGRGSCHAITTLATLITDTRHALQVATGDVVAASVSAQLALEEKSCGVAARVVTVPDTAGSGDALRAVLPRLTAAAVVVYSGDLLTDVPLRALLAKHQVGPPGGVL